LTSPLSTAPSSPGSGFTTSSFFEDDFDERWLLDFEEEDLCLLLPGEAERERERERPGERDRERESERECDRDRRDREEEEWW
jgi:hypothetical protein